MSLRSELEALNAATATMLAALGHQPSTAQSPSNPAPSVSRPFATTANPAGTVSINQTALLQLVNMTRRFIRYSREGNVPSKQQRKYGRRAIKAVKHLLPPRDVPQDSH